MQGNNHSSGKKTHIYFIIEAAFQRLQQVSWTIVSVIRKHAFRISALDDTKRPWRELAELPQAVVYLYQTVLFTADMPYRLTESRHTLSIGIP